MNDANRLAAPYANLAARNAPELARRRKEGTVACETCRAPVCCEVLAVEVAPVEVPAVFAAARALPAEVFARVTENARGWWAWWTASGLSWTQDGVRRVHDEYARGGDAACPLLVGGRCSIQADKPGVCRHLWVVATTQSCRTTPRGCSTVGHVLGSAQDVALALSPLDGGRWRPYLLAEVVARALLGLPDAAPFDEHVGPALPRLRHVRARDVARC